MNIVGFDYFGARYYDSDISVWLSVDPLADKYPSTSPYMYVRGNPVMLIDPDGMSDNADDIYVNKGKEVARIKNDKPDRKYNVSSDGKGGWVVNNDPVNNSNTTLSEATVTANRNGSSKNVGNGNKRSWFWDKFGLNVKGGEGEPSEFRKALSEVTVYLKQLMNWDKPSEEPIQINTKKQNANNNKLSDEYEPQSAKGARLDPKQIIKFRLSDKNGRNVGMGSFGPTYTTYEVMREDSAATVKIHNENIND